jgi:hypothetical protein
MACSKGLGTLSAVLATVVVVPRAKGTATHASITNVTTRGTRPQLFLIFLMNPILIFSFLAWPYWAIKQTFSRFFSLAKDIHLGEAAMPRQAKPETLSYLRADSTTGHPLV